MFELLETHENTHILNITRMADVMRTDQKHINKRYILQIITFSMFVSQSIFCIYKYFYDQYIVFMAHIEMMNDNILFLSS